MKLTIPELSLVVLIGPSGSGKSTFAAKHFLPTEVVSSDACRGLVSDDANNQAVTPQAFRLLNHIVGARLALGRLTVVDATNVQPDSRKPLVQLAREHDCLPAAIVLNVPAQVCRERNEAREDRSFGPHVVRQQLAQLRRHVRGLRREGFRSIHVLDGVEAIEAATIERTKLWTDHRDRTGPFDIVGDVHGCYDELLELLDKLGYVVAEAGTSPRVHHPEGRTLVFVGDLVDRGPRSPDVLRLAMAAVRESGAIWVPGNHDVKLQRKLAGKDVRITHGLGETLEQLAREPEGFGAEVEEFIRGLVSHVLLDGGQLVVAHAGMKEAYQGRASARVRDFALYGETTGETDDFGLPVRFDWASEYRGRAAVIYGHTPVYEAQWVNGTLCIDTGCVFGGRLTALRYPERELVDVPAHKTWYESPKPLGGTEEAPPAAARRAYDDLLDLQDVIGKRIVSTRIRGTVTLRGENAAGALEVMSRFAVDPRWLVYLPPTMSPSETCREGPSLEHPREAFAYYREAGVPHVVCEEKHMGSRSVFVLARDPETAAARFGVADGKQGVVYTRTGRPFFTDADLEAAVVARVARAVEGAGLWEDLDTSWLCLDAELLPWSAKARALLETQYAAVGTAGTRGLTRAVELLELAAARVPECAELQQRTAARLEMLQDYVEAYRRYCWPVDGLDDLRVAPFQILAGEGAVHAVRDHRWHMEALAKVAATDPSWLLATAWREVDLTDPTQEEAATAWWEERTAAGGEGMVVKALEPLTRGRRGLVQPAVKCRGREYLRIIYGPEYTAPENLERLRARSLHRKRSLALREYALGLEALHRFVEREPLYRVHECVFGVLALESEPVDPRL
ncbi:MAG: polynucleotide kinase-phosphatase [Planctomycetota bacterium]